MRTLNTLAFIALAAGLNSQPPTTPANNTVTVIVHRIKAVSNFDGDFIKKDRADFYTKVGIGGSWNTSQTWHGQDDARPSWATVEYVSGRAVLVTIQVMDDDGGLERGDDHADINPTEGVKDLRVWYNPTTGRIWGDAEGMKGDKLYSRGAGSDSDKAEIWFSIS